MVEHIKGDNRMKKLKSKIKQYRRYGYKTIWKKIGGLFAILDCILTQILLGSSPEEYIVLELWRKSFREKRTYLFVKRNTRIYNYVKSHVTAEQFAQIGNKFAFNQFFNQYVRREYLNAAEADENTVREFIEKHGVVLAKKLSNTQGKGILKITKEDIDPDLLKKMISGSYLLEEFIIQHKSISKINSSSVNTIRVATAVDSEGCAHIVGACLRCGVPGNYVDNFHAGGVAYPIDVDTGVVVNAGKNNSNLKQYIVHPGSCSMMLGFRIPNWDVLVHQVRKAAEMVPEMLFLGWDIAVTEDGVDFVEANIGQSASLIQLDHKGRLEMIRKLLPIRF